MIEVKFFNTKTAEDNCVQELQGQIDVLINEQAMFEEKLQEQVVLQRKIESLKRHKTHMLSLLMEDEECKVQNLDLSSQVEALIGHLGYQSLKYWLNSEVQLHKRRSGDKPEEPERTIRLSKFDDNALRYAATLSESKQAEWRRILMRFQEDLARVEHLCQPLTYSYEREELVQKDELNVGHYLHASSVLWV